MKYTFGFIGTGNMGSALAQAASKTVDPQNIILSNRTPSKAEALASRLGCCSGSNSLAAAESRYLFLAVKPQMMADMLSGISGDLRQRTDSFVLVTIAAGLTIARIRELAGADYPVIRIMPNTPCAIGSGVILCSRSDNVSDGDYENFKQMMQGAGTLIDLSENLIDAGSAISGCGPAYVYVFLEALADAGVACGLTRADAKKLAAATVRGSAELAMVSDKHTAQLKDEVCSPGGSTIEGVLRLENGGFRGTVADCVKASFEKNKSLGKN